MPDKKKKKSTTDEKVLRKMVKILKMDLKTVLGHFDYCTIPSCEEEKCKLAQGLKEKYDL